MRYDANLASRHPHIVRRMSSPRNLSITLILAAHIAINLVNVARFGFIRFDGDAVIVQSFSAALVGMATLAGLTRF